MKGLIRASLGNPYAVIVSMLTIIVIGVLVPDDDPRSTSCRSSRRPRSRCSRSTPACRQTAVEKDITNRIERWTGQAANMSRQESRSIVGASVVRNYFQTAADPNGALGQVMSLATGTLPTLPPGTLPPVVLPFDPTATVPACIVALDSKTQSESTLYDVGRYEVRNMIMAIPGAVAPVVFGGKVRTVLAYLDRQKMQARQITLTDVMNALDRYNLFMPTGDAKFGDTDFAIDSNSMYNVVDEMKGIPLRTRTRATPPIWATWARPRTRASFRPTSCASTAGGRSIFRSFGNSAPAR